MWRPPAQLIIIIIIIIIIAAVAVVKLTAVVIGDVDGVALGADLCGVDAGRRPGAEATFWDLHVRAENGRRLDERRRAARARRRGDAEQRPLVARLEQLRVQTASGSAAVTDRRTERRRALSSATTGDESDQETDRGGKDHRHQDTDDVPLTCVIRQQ